LGPVHAVGIGVRSTGIRWSRRRAAVFISTPYTGHGRVANMKRGGPIAKRCRRCRARLVRATCECGAINVPIGRNAKRSAVAKAVAFGVQAGLCRTLPCCACGAAPRSQAHHEPPRGMGGARGKDSETVPLCAGCHRLRHDVGLLEFTRRTGVDLFAVRAAMRSRVAGGSLSPCTGLPY
jgi:hypothetical protein